MKKNDNNLARVLKPFVLSVLLLLPLFLNAQFVHPGLSHKKSDLDRMKYMVNAKIEPFYSSYQHMCNLSTAKHDYVVKGSTDIWNYGEERGWKDPWFNDDARAAYYGAIRWYVEEDERYAKKAIEAINAWSGLTNLNTKMSLTSAPIWLMIEAAELIKHTYDGWAEEDIKKFGDMLVYPGYSDTTAPSGGNYTWYWSAYMFDQARAGNQELCGVRTVAAIGVFLDNQKIYDRAMNYVSALPTRDDDIPGARGPRIQGALNLDNSNDFNWSYDVPNPENTEEYADWGYCGVLKYNIYPNGQNVESSRDQAHTCFSLGLLNTLGEIAWSQSYDLFSRHDFRLVKGLEYTLRYCVSGSKSFDDQPTPWEPQTFVDLEGYEEPLEEHASYDIIQMANRTKRNKDKTISSDAREGFPTYNTWELPIAHYIGRGLKNEDDLKWTIRARDYAREVNGHYEPAATGQDYTGYGALVYYRAEGCAGDPISGFDGNGLPMYDMNVAPCVIEAENFDYNPINAEGRIYHDATETNTGGEYRADQGVDIEACGEGGYQLTSLEAGEWLVYTVAVSEGGYYDFNLRYAAANGDGKVMLEFGGENISGEVSVPFGGEFSQGIDNYADFTAASGLLLQKGVYALKVNIAGVSESFVLNSISIEKDGSTHIEAEDYSNMSGVSVEETTDSEGKQHVTSIDASDWMEYDVYLPYTQNYILEYRLASASGGEYEITLDGEVLETFAYTSTDDADSWETQASTLSFAIEAGNHTLKIEAKSSGSKLNWIDIVKDESNCASTKITPYFTVYNTGAVSLGTFQTDSIPVVPGYSLQLSAMPKLGGTWSWTGPNGFTSTERVLMFYGIEEEKSGDYTVVYTNDCGAETTETFVIEVSDSLIVQAEDFSAMSGVTTAETTDDGSGFMVTGIELGDYMEYEINVPYTGNYIFEYRVSGGSEGAFVLSNGVEELEKISFDATGGDQNWITVSSASVIKLTEGTNTLKISATASDWNLNWLQLNLQDLLLPCELPFTVEAIKFTNAEAIWQSGVIDLACADSVNLFMNIEGIGELEDSDYINVYYKLDGGEEMVLLEVDGALSATKIVETDIKAETIELIIYGSTNSVDETYLVSNIRLSEQSTFDRIEAEDFDEMLGIDTQSTNDVDGNENVGWVHNDDWLMYKDVDITGAKSFNFRYSSPKAGNTIEMRLDAVDGPLIGNLKLNQTGSFNTWQTQGTNLIPTDGIYDIYLILKGGDGYLFNINWFQYSTELLDVSTDATVTSTEYLVNEENKIIGIPTLIIISEFLSNIVPAEGATVEVFQSDGVTPATFASAGYKVVVTAADGITTSTYTIDFVTGVGAQVDQVNSVFPNPAQDVLYIQMAIDGDKTYRVLDMLGKSIANGKLSGDNMTHELNISSWPNGVYILQVEGSTGSSTVKVIKK